MKAELTHDSLAARIFAKASAEDKALRKVHNFIKNRLSNHQEQGFQMSAEDLAYISPYLDKLPLSEDEEAFIEKSKHVLSNRKRLVWGGIALAVIFFIFLAFSLSLWSNAEKIATIASNAADSASVTTNLIAQEVASIQEERKNIEILNVKIIKAKQQADSLSEVAIVEAQKARMAEAEARKRSKEAQEEARRVAEAAQIKLQETANKKQAAYLLSEASQALIDGDVRLAFLLAEQANQLFNDTLVSQVLIKVAQSRVQYSFQADSGISAVALSQDHRYMLAGSKSGNIVLTQLKNSRPSIKMSQADEITDLQFSADGKFSLSASKDGKAVLWDEQGQQVHVFAHEAAVNTAIFAPSGKILTSSDDHTLKLWDRQGKLIQNFSHQGKVTQAIMDKEERFILSASEDSSAILWSLEGDLLHKFSHVGAVTSIAMSPEGGLILTASQDQTVKLWRLSDFELLANMQHESAVVDASFRADFKDAGLSPDLMKDTDKDGIDDLNDVDNNTPEGAIVDKSGAVLDTDEDGVLDHLDKEPNTPWGASVDQEGRALDYDKDGVIDFYDLEKYSPEGAEVNFLGIARDDDADGVINLNDKDLNTPRAYVVNQEGLGLDTDGDGVYEFLDKEQNTPEGAEVDFWGRAIDSDKDGIIDLSDEEINSPAFVRVDDKGNSDRDGDGIPDKLDKELNSPERSYVNDQGQADNDQDGIPDTQDREWYTPESAEIDERSGIALDTDQDGLPDLIDFQKNTPAEYIKQIDAFGREPGYRGDPIFSGKVIMLTITGDEVYDIHGTFDSSATGDPYYLDIEEAKPDNSKISYILTASADGRIRIWDLANARVETESLVPQTMTQAGFIKEDSAFYAISTQRNEALFFDTSGKVARILEHNSHINHLDFLSKKEVLTASEYGLIRIWGEPFPSRDPAEILNHYYARFPVFSRQELRRFSINLR